MMRFMLPSYFTELRVRIPAAATEPNSTMPAPPRTGGGMTAKTPPTTGSSPSNTRMTPPAVTTNRERTQENATSTTFWANADWVNELNNGATAEEIMYARRPTAIRRGVTSVSTISATAMMSAVVSVMMTRTTTSIETIAPTWNVGVPNANGVGKATMPPSATPEKSTLPMMAAMTVPMTMASRIDSREIVATPTFERARTMTSV